MKTVTFETAKRLYDLGINIKCERVYAIHAKRLDYSFQSPYTHDSIGYGYYYAPDAQELQDRMPKRIKVKDRWYHLDIDFNDENGHPEYIMWEYGETYYLADLEFKSNLLQERLSDLIFWLIENKYITVERINKGE